MDDSDTVDDHDPKKGGDLIQDIFGSDDDDDNDVGIVSSSKGFDDNDGWDDSDDEMNKKSSKGSRLQKSKLSKKSSTSSKPTAADIFGSDDDDDDEPSRSHERKETKKRRKSKDGKGKLLKKKRIQGDDGKKEKSGDSGDEYDSGEEVTRTKDDDAFIDDDDDQGYLVREYDEDNQDFRDDRPDDYKHPHKSSSKSSSKKSRDNNGSSNKVDSKADDPLSETIRAMKKQKEVLLSQAEKESFVKDLLHRMSIATAKDDDLMSKGQPATYKLQMLDNVKKAIVLQPLQESLVENDVLSRLKEWIEPKQDSERTLPSLTVRSAVYDMLLNLPCYAEHLKRSGIGVTIMALRKHKAETLSNKKMLKDIVEKWCRPLFGKSVDQRSRDMDYNDEMRVAASRQKFSAATSDSTVALDSILGSSSTSSAIVNDSKARVRTPYNNGYVFTVRPENRTVEKRDLQRERMGESRMNLMKITRVSKGGVKDNFRAVQVDMSGRDKA